MLEGVTRSGASSWIQRLALLSVGALISLAYVKRESVASIARGELDLLGRAVFVTGHAQGTDGVDWTVVHTTLLPRWMMAMSQRPRTEHDRTQRAGRRAEAASQRAYTRLRFALRADHNLVELFDELDGLLRSDPLGEAERIDYLLWAYNYYLDRNDVPWRVEATMHLRRDRTPAFYTRSYEVIADMQEGDERLRLVRRVDLTNIDEGFLGHTTGRNEGALVMVNQTLQFAVRRIWPLLNGSLDQWVDPSLRHVAPHVREQARQALSEEQMALLEETAVDELALIEVADAIEARHECGSEFRVYGLPWNGLAPPDQRALVDALDRSQNRECPEVTLSEAARMIGASQRLGETAGLRDAVEHLSTFVAGAVSVHELRHAADRNDSRECVGCPAGMSAAAIDELSAYLASFADERFGYVALAQACAMEDDVAGSLSPHAQALALALPDLMEGGCRAGVPDGLRERALALDARYFGPRRSVGVPRSFPRRLQLLR